MKIPPLYNLMQSKVPSKRISTAWCFNRPSPIEANTIHSMNWMDLVAVSEEKTEVRHDVNTVVTKENANTERLALHLKVNTLLAQMTKPIVDRQ